MPPIHTSEMTRSTLMPVEADRAGLSATARVALPRRVNRSSEVAATSTIIPMRITARSREVMRIGPNSQGRTAAYCE